MMESSLYIDVEDFQWPIVYRSEYNVRFLGLEKLHPFDAGKWGRVFQYLKGSGLIDEDIVTTPNEAKNSDLLFVHSRKYLNSLKCSWKVARIAEIPPLCLVPNFLVQGSYLRPMRYQTGGTVLAGKLALERGWAINIGGGFHHCSSKRGGGFCPYADITLLTRFVMAKFSNRVKKVMIVDLDAHQGNGHERDFIGNENVYIMDVYNKHIYPCDAKAKTAIKRRVELDNYTEDSEYLMLVRKNLTQALNEFAPDLLIYNAGTDVLSGDSLGRLAISPDGIVQRDEIVFTRARSACIPIVMLTSGGYLKQTASIIADSILNLHEKNLIVGPLKRF